MACNPLLKRLLDKIVGVNSKRCQLLSVHQKKELQAVDVPAWLIWVSVMLKRDMIADMVHVWCWIRKVWVMRPNRFAAKPAQRT